MQEEIVEYAFIVSPKIKIIGMGLEKITHPLFKVPIIGLFVRKRVFEQHYRKEIDKINPDVIINSTYRYLDSFFVPGYRKGRVMIKQNHSSLSHELYCIKQERKRKPTLKDRFLDWYHMRQISKYDIFHTLTVEDLQYRLLNGYGKVPMKVIPNVVSKYNTSPQYNVNSRMVISAGRIEENKRIKDQILIWKEVSMIYPDWTLHIYGDGPQKEELTILINSLGLTKKIFLEGRTD